MRELAKILSIDLDDLNLLMVLLAFTWRNRVVHSDADTKVNAYVKARMLDRADEISERYRALNVRRAIAACEESAPPSFREVAGIVEASHKLVKSIDELAIAES